MSEDTTKDIEVVGPEQAPMVSEITQPTTGQLQRLEAEVQALKKAHHWATAMAKTEKKLKMLARKISMA